MINEFFFDYNLLSSALCDIHDVKETLAYLDANKTIQDSIAYVEDFLKSLKSKNIDSAELVNCIAQIHDVKNSLDEEMINEPKDNDGTEFTIGDCLQDVIAFLESLARQE